MDLRGKRRAHARGPQRPVEEGRVTDATRIERIVPTVEAILRAGGKPILLAHFDRPKGTVVPAMSLRQVLPRSRPRLPPRAFAPDCVGPRPRPRSPP
jgi:phosphoglycerate kinase